MDKRVTVLTRLEEILDLIPEVMRMRLCSVETVVRLGCDDSEHLTLPAH